MSSPLFALRQSTAEVLAYTFSQLFPEALLVDCEITETGFYYDFSMKQTLTDEVIPLLEERMRCCIKEGVEIGCMEMMRENAVSYFSHLKQPYLVEQLQESREKIVRVVKIGEFVDLCPIEPLSNTNEIGAFKILHFELSKVRRLPVLRIHGTAFPDKMALKKFLKRLDALKGCDHQILGKEMQLFEAVDETSPGCWLWLPKGTLLRNLLQKWWGEQHSLSEYQPITTPSFVEVPLLKKIYSRYLPYQECFFPEIEFDGKECFLNPPQELMHALAFKCRSSGELPVRYVEWGEILHDVKNSSFWGLFRSRSTQTDTVSIFCSASQLYDELISSLLLIDKTVRMFGFGHHWYLRSKGRKFAGTLKQWDHVQSIMVKALDDCTIDYSLDKGNPAFYGPQIEVRITDAIGREWSGPRLGVDFNLPEKLGIYCQNQNEVTHAPTMITRSIFGSLERFIAILIEHYAGVLPFWLSPEQVRILPVSEKNAGYAEDVCAKCLQAGLRAKIDRRKESLGTKVHAAEQEKIPYYVIVGEKEEKTGSITIRKYNQNAEKMELSSFLSSLLAEEKEKIAAFMMADEDKHKMGL